jgi:hypothetical protein
MGLGTEITVLAGASSNLAASHSAPGQEARCQDKLIGGKPLVIK